MGLQMCNTMLSPNRNNLSSMQLGEVYIHSATGLFILFLTIYTITSILLYIIYVLYIWYIHISYIYSTGKLTYHTNNIFPAFRQENSRVLLLYIFRQVSILKELKWKYHENVMTTIRNTKGRKRAVILLLHQPLLSELPRGINLGKVSKRSWIQM
jgi:hypothetical protein